ncbi:hypothetical protein RUM43_004460 [Polyplax serrata]|uniref:Uncharacterized protein n=1 Tax=Polyplax serrata TaxID=468196 RepID=A0AAN8SAW6_POLSC
MENLSGAHTNDDRTESRDVGSNTEPSGCCFCSSRAYTQANSYKNCFNSFFLGPTPSCKQTTGSLEDGQYNHEPVFSSPPMFRPVFQNRPVPHNVFCSILTPSTPAKEADETQAQEDSEVAKLSQPSCHILDFPHGNYEYTFSDPSLRKCDLSGVTTCPCNNALPWTYGPYVFPMIPFFVSWNPTQPCQPSGPKIKNENLTTSKPSDDVIPISTREELSFENNVLTEKHSAKEGEKAKFGDFDGSSTPFDSEAENCALRGSSLFNDGAERKLDDQECREGIDTNDKDNSLAETVNSEYPVESSVTVSPVSSRLTTESYCDTEIELSTLKIQEEDSSGGEKTSAVEKWEEELQELKFKDKHSKRLVNNFTMTEEVQSGLCETKSSSTVAIGDAVEVHHTKSVQSVKNDLKTPKTDNVKSEEVKSEEVESIAEVVAGEESLEKTKLLTVLPTEPTAKKKTQANFNSKYGQEIKIPRLLASSKVNNSPGANSSQKQRNRGTVSKLPNSLNRKVESSPPKPDKNSDTLLKTQKLKPRGVTHSRGQINLKFETMRVTQGNDPTESKLPLGTLKLRQSTAGEKDIKLTKNKS